VRVRVPDVMALNQATLTVQLADSAHTFLPQRDRWAAEVGPVVRPILERGLAIPAVDYLAAQQTIERFRQEFAEVWRHCDCLFAPSTPVAAPGIDQNTLSFNGIEEEVRIATTRMQRGVNALGLPALAMPCGFSPDSRPYGLQIIGPPFEESRLLRIGAAVEDRTDFHSRRPPVL
jgi:aspartyl-tRNA(Asn)/glutamyl-tRNA(Gln) amidotransferase subunit A